MTRPSVAVGALVFNKEGKLLLVETHKWKGSYSIPGGHVEFGETLEEALKREVMEETNLDISKIELLLVHEAITPKEYHKKKHFVFIDYTCLASSGKVKLNSEGQSHKWVYPRDALKHKLEPYTKKLIDKYLER